MKIHVFVISPNLSHDNQVQKETIEEKNKTNRDLVISMQRIQRQGREAQVLLEEFRNIKIVIKSRAQMAQLLLVRKEQEHDKLNEENEKLISDLAQENVLKCLILSYHFSKK